MSETFDRELVRLAIEDAPRALDALCAQWLPTVLGWTTRLGGPRIDPEDAAHDVFLVVLRRLPGLSDPAAFRSWLFSISRRVVAAHRRRAWVRRWLPGAPPEERETAPDPLRRAEQSDVATQVWAAIEKLPSHQREVLVLCDLEERADAEVAEMLGVPKGTVKSRLRRARLALREQVGSLVEVELPSIEAAAGGS